MRDERSMPAVSRKPKISSKCARRPSRSAASANGVPSRSAAKYGEGSLGFVTDQDTFNLVRVQKGMRSRGFESLVLGKLEARLHHMHRVIDEYLFG